MNHSNHLAVPSYSAASFRWHGKEGTAEISELNPGAHYTGRRGIDARVWNDACDVGFIVRSPRTGNEILFTFEKVSDNDGEVTHWLYRGYGPENSEFTVIIFND